MPLTGAANSLENRNLEAPDLWHLTQATRTYGSPMKTFTATPADIEKKWILIDAEGVILGRLVLVSQGRILDRWRMGPTEYRDLLRFGVDDRHCRGKERFNLITIGSND